MNPFSYGRVVSGDEYCPRILLEDALKAKLLNAQNVYLEGERRTGKTSLIMATIQKTRGRKALYADFLEVRTVEDIHKRLLDAMIRIDKDLGILPRMIKNFAALRPVISYDPMSGSPSLSVDSSVSLKPDSLSGLFDLFLGNDFKNVVVVIDEFQDILNLPDFPQALAIMRGRIQFITGVPFVFCGSVRRKMHVMFNDPDSPFFKSASPLEVGTLDPVAFRLFIGRKFKKVGIEVDGGTIDRILSITGENPGDTQQLCAGVYDVTHRGQAVTESTVREALRYVFAQEQKGYEASLARLTAVQLRSLSALARVGGKNTLAREFLVASGIRHPSTIKKALQRLEELKIVCKNDREYKFVNPFFGQWLLHVNF